MTKQTFLPPPVLPSSRFLVAKIKIRINEAIELVRPRDARMYLDIIERLARMNWLDDPLPVIGEPTDQELLRTAKVAADKDRPFAQSLQTPTGHETKSAQMHAEPQKGERKKSGCPWEELKQPLPTFTDYRGETAPIGADAHASPQKRQSLPIPPVTGRKDKPRKSTAQLRYDQGKSVRRNLEDYLKSAAALSR